ncbi:hypothetical protein [Nonomuraea pusilla]|uniref:Uncharacterized protein n=1 Tax=Nonomuraea pusilla TaxID=46177 RepID=A0A1H8I0U5_9ACTN|nr:hypothetical protein [Nonomuraea pusilla]SEN62370.1 hypothetical protein SAMN05660976_07936 [Nonomuraea pusilla]
MESADGRVILFILIGIALFALGRRFQEMVTSRQNWKHTAKQVTARRDTAFQAVRSLIGFGLIAVFVVWLVLALNRQM